MEISPVTCCEKDVRSVYFIADLSSDTRQSAFKFKIHVTVNTLHLRAKQYSVLVLGAVGLLQILHVMVVVYVVDEFLSNHAVVRGFVAQDGFLSLLFGLDIKVVHPLWVEDFIYTVVLSVTLICLNLLLRCHNPQWKWDKIT